MSTPTWGKSILEIFNFSFSVQIAETRFDASCAMKCTIEWYLPQFFYITCTFKCLSSWNTPRYSNNYFGVQCKVRRQIASNIPVELIICTNTFLNVMQTLLFYFTMTPSSKNYQLRTDGPQLYLSESPTLYFFIGNHNSIAKALGYTVKAYKYWDEEGRKLNIDGMIEDLKVRNNK